MTLARMFDCQLNREDAAARGKVVLIGNSKTEQDEFESCCFQVKNKEAMPVYCGNATAVASATWAALTSKDSFTFKFVCLEHNFSISAYSKTSSGLFEIQQEWRFSDKPIFEEFALNERRAIRSSFLNNYHIIDGSKNESVDSALNIDNLDFKIGLRDKVAIIESDGLGTRVNFYNCNGMHGGAPQTGLATLALAAQKVDWLHEYLCQGKVITPSGLEDLPIILSRPNDLPRLSLQPTKVSLKYLGAGK